jgi:hypothetical protein
MPVLNNNLGKFFSPSASYAGFVFIGCGIFTAFYSLFALTLLLPGFFMAFSYNGTLIDTDRKRVKSYTSLFGIIKTGEWVNIDEFTNFSIIKATKNFTTYSRANLRFDMKLSDIELLISNTRTSKRIVLNTYNNLSDAQREMDSLREILLPQLPTKS